MVKLSGKSLMRIEKLVGREDTNALWVFDTYPLCYLQHLGPEDGL